MTDAPPPAEAVHDAPNAKFSADRAKDIYSDLRPRGGAPTTPTTPTTPIWREITAAGPGRGLALGASVDVK